MSDSQDILTSDNRRSNPRPPLPRFGMIVRLDEMIAAMIENMKHHWTGRIILMSLIAAALGSVWWSYHYRLSLVESSSAYIKRLYVLQRDVDISKMRWHEGSLQQEQAQVIRYEKTVMPSLETMNAWLQQQINIMQSKGLQASWHIEGLSPISHTLTDMRVLLVSLEIHQPSGKLDFSKVLSVLASVISSGWRVEMQSLSMDGKGKGMEKITVAVRIWLKQSEDIDRMSKLQGES